MPFCVKCGKQLAEGTRFCTGCGTPVGGEAENDGTKRVQKFEGEIRKCPNCGTVLESFQAVCPSCGFELRGDVKVASSVQKLMDKIAEIERTREEVAPVESSFTSTKIQLNASKTDVSIANVIKVFPVPNTIEEILEFVMLASSNIDSSVLVNRIARATKGSPSEVAGQNAISEAWLSKMNQMYKKASMSFASSPKFQEVKIIYDEKIDEIKKTKKRALFLNPLSISFEVMFVLLIILSIIAAIAL